MSEKVKKAIKENWPLLVVVAAFGAMLLYGLITGKEIPLKPIILFLV